MGPVSTTIAGRAATPPRAVHAGRVARIDPALPRVLTIVLTLRLVLGVDAWLVTALRPGSDAAVSWDGLQLTGGGLTGALIAPWQRDDALWFQRVAERGYGHDARAAFLPVYPATEHVTAWLVGGGAILAGLLVSTVAAVVALTLLHRLVRTRLDTATADRCVLYLALLPTGFFLLAPYSEALFLAFAVGSVLAASRGRFAAAGVVAALAAATRPQGVLLVVPIAIEVCADMRNRRAAGQRPLRLGYAALLLPVAALGALELWLRGSLGFAAGSLTVEHAFWGNHEAAPWTVLGDSLRAIASGGHPEELLNLLALLAAVSSLPFMARRLPPAWTALAVVWVMPLLLRENQYSPLMSASRFLLVTFPLAVLLARAGASPRVHRLVTTLSPALLVLLFANFVRFHLVG